MIVSKIAVKYRSASFLETFILKDNLVVKSDLVIGHCSLHKVDGGLESYEGKSKFRAKNQ